MKLKKLLTEAFEGVGGIVTPGAFGKGEGFYSSPKKQKVNQKIDTNQTGI